MDRSLQSNEYLIQQQMDMFDTRPLEIVKELQELDVDVITPIEAIGILHKLVQKAQE